MDKVLNFSVGFIFATLAANSVFASEMNPRKELLDDIKDETRKCAVQSVSVTNETRQVIGYSSTCPTLKIISMSQAQIFIDGQWFAVKIVESSESDGGDLDDLYVADMSGKIVAKRLNIAAYDSVIVAMAGTSELREK